MHDQYLLPMWSTIQTQHQFAITMTPMCTLKSANSLVFTASRACEFAAKEHMYVHAICCEKLARMAYFSFIILNYNSEVL